MSKDTKGGCPDFVRLDIVFSFLDTWSLLLFFSLCLKCNVTIIITCKDQYSPVADAEFTRGRSLTSEGIRQIIVLKICCQKLHEN